jgi:hypothetical protein
MNNSKPRSFGGIFILLIFCFILFGLIEARTQNQKKDDPQIKEFVEVVNVEMTVRALRKGKPVGDLKAGDFILTENGKRLNITSFTEIRRKIGTRDDIELEENEDTPKSKKRRFFLLYFWIQERHVKYRESLDYFFENIFREGDMVIFAINNKAIKVTKLEEVPNAIDELEKEVQINSETWKRWIEETVRRQQNAFNVYLEELQERIPNPQKLETYRGIIAAEIQSTWTQYRYKYLSSNTAKLYALADSLKSFPIEKWGIVYFQHTPFPLFDSAKVDVAITRYSRFEAIKMAQLLHPYVLKTKMPPAPQTHIKPIQQAFISANSTFHLLLPNVRTRLDIISDHIKLNDVYSGWQDTFREITLATGGEIIIGNLLKTSLQKAVDREDIFYRFTYRPHILDKEKRKIKINSTVKGLKIFHVSKVKVTKPKYIQLSDVSFKDSILSVTVKNYHFVGIEDQQMGDVQLVITASDENGGIMEYMKRLELESEEATISMKLKIPADVKHTILITAWDNLSGLNDQQTVQINH